MARTPRRQTPRHTAQAEHMHTIMNNAFGNQRLTLDSPIRPDVWLGFAKAPDDRLDVIITPTDDMPPGPTAVFIRERLDSGTQKEARVAYGRSTISAALTLRELTTLVVPLSNWWKTVVLRLSNAYEDMTAKEAGRSPPAMQRGPHADPPEGYRLRLSYDWLVASAGKTDIATLASRYLLWDLFRFAALRQVANARAPSAAAFDRMVAGLTNDRPSSDQIREVIAAFEEYVDPIDETMNAMRNGRAPATPEGGSIARSRWGAVWSVTRNREASTALTASQRTIKADAACAVFAIRTDDINWAVVDGGIDARHPAFQNRAAANRNENPLATTRVRATYDFTLLRDLLATGELPAGPEWVRRNAERHEARLAEVKARLLQGDDIDWSIVAPLIEMPTTTFTNPRHRAWHARCRHHWWLLAG
jgi:serine protease AprX